MTHSSKVDGSKSSSSLSLPSCEEMSSDEHGGSLYSISIMNHIDPYTLLHDIRGCGYRFREVGDSAILN